jgi:hypothetical protein
LTRIVPVLCSRTIQAHPGAQMEAHPIRRVTGRWMAKRDR